MRGSEGKWGPSRWVLQVPRAEHRVRLGRGVVTKGSGLLRVCFKDKTSCRGLRSASQDFQGDLGRPQPVSGLWQGAE